MIEEVTGMTTLPDFHQPEIPPFIHYTAREILTCRQELRDILIAPFDEAKCKGIGYNLSPSELCYSVKKKRLLQIHRTPQEIYVLIPPNDTILTLSYEYLQVSSQIAGCFLSRLRPVTQGLGNISTTLDPCWKGMLLLSISNPSSQKIKLVIKQMKDDIFTPVAITTMLLWQIAPSADGSDGTLTFHLDNPAMRTDIWSDLVSQPYRLFCGKHYRHFQELIHALTYYQPTVNHPEWIAQLQAKLDRLQNAVQAEPRQYNIIRETLLDIYHQEREPMAPELIKKLNNLYSFGQLQDTSSSVFSVDSLNGFKTAVEKILAHLSAQDAKENQQNTDEFIKLIYLLYQECNYQKLCEQVDEIHQIIREKTQYRWRMDGIKRFWYRVIRPHLSALLATVLLAFILL